MVITKSESLVSFMSPNLSSELCYTWEHSQCESRKVVTWAVAAEAPSSRALEVHDA